MRCEVSSPNRHDRSVTSASRRVQDKSTRRKMRDVRAMVLHRREESSLWNFLQMAVVLSKTHCSILTSTP